jgi:hypothetical protein
MDTYTAAAATTAGKTSQERDREAVAAAGRVLPPIVHRMLGFKDTGLSNSPPDATLPRLFSEACSENGELLRLAHALLMITPLLPLLLVLLY